MSKTVFPILIAFLALWIFGGAYWLSNLFPSQIQTGSSGEYPNKFVVSDGEFSVESPTIFAFQTSDADIILNDDHLAVFEQLATFLDEFKEKQLRLTGICGQSETNTSRQHENLGKARAESIKNILVRFGTPEAHIITEGKVLEKLILNENGLISGGVEFDIFDKDISNIISKAPFLKEKIYYFPKNSYVLPENHDLESFTAELKQFMVDEKMTKVMVTGFQTTDEHLDIDVLRVKFIEDFFNSHGVDAERVTLDLHPPGNLKDERKIEIKVL